MYESFIKPILFLFDPEFMHDFFVSLGEAIGNIPGGAAVTRAFCNYAHPSLETKVAGIDFKNPIGLAAGFDKDVRLTKVIPAVGFGFMEAGAVTQFPYGGNPGRELLRLPEDRSIIVYYGLKSIGAGAVKDKLAALLPLKIPTGLNIAKTNRADIKGEKSVEDYVMTYRMLAPQFTYVTLNVSCPNAQDGCLFQDPQMLNSLLSAFAKEEKKGPIFLKISNDLTFKEVDDVLAVTGKYPFIDGFVVGNLAKRHGVLKLKSSQQQLDLIPEGGISGAPLKDLSTNIIRHIYRKTNGKYILIGLGGVFTAEDAYEKIKAGASLVQIITGLIYNGPTVVKKINKGLAELLARDGYKHVSEAVGKEAGK
ncbi:MAG: quinone-dependent dihydroorotate dehydrogenase [Minisyncoccia bacterium]